MTLTPCGTCIGCDTDAAVRRQVAEIDAIIMPRIQRIAEREPDERAVAELLEERSRMIGVVLRLLNPPGCIAPRVSKTPAEPAQLHRNLA